MRAALTHLAVVALQLILLALLLGSDYTSGCRGIGPKKAIKLVRLLDACCSSFLATPAGRAVPRNEHATMALWRAVCAADTAEAAVQLLLDCHAKCASSCAAAPSIQPTFAAMSVSQLSFEMSQRGLKPLTSAVAMIAKLEFLAANAAAVPAAATADAIIYISDDDDSSSDSSDDEDAASAAGTAAAAAAAASRSKPPGAKGKKASKGSKASSSRQLSLQSFLRTYVGKIHARYHATPNRAEMELVLQSYLQPALQPTIDSLEKLIHTRMSAETLQHARPCSAHRCLHLLTP